MEINRETANRLWVKQFGRKAKARDFAGREIDKAAYDSRSSKYGWNVDHIYPQSMGGKTNDSNLICCHMQTNSEKADKFPCFSANGKQFEIRRRQNHYEIFEKNGTSQSNVVNFMDAGQGIEFWESCGYDENTEEKDHFSVFVKIRIYKIFNPLIPNKMDEFLDNLFRPDDSLNQLFDPDEFIQKDSSYSYESTLIWYDMPLQKNIQNVLNDCITLNTYAKNLWYPRYGTSMGIACGMIEYAGKHHGRSKVKEEISAIHSLGTSVMNRGSNLVIDRLVCGNTDAKKHIQRNDLGAAAGCYGTRFLPYDRVWPDLEEDLKNSITK